MLISAKKQIPCFILIGVNVILFALGFFAFDKYDWMMNADTVYRQHEYWRVLSSMFLHGDIRHLAFNMISLFGLSGLILAYYPVWEYYVLYFGAGILGGFSNAAVRLAMGNRTFSLGASGAIMGLLGANIAFYIKNRRQIAPAALRSQLLRLGIFATINLIPESSSVDYLGHLFGFIWGFLIGLLMNIRSTAEPRQ